MHFASGLGKYRYNKDTFIDGGKVICVGNSLTQGTGGVAYPTALGTHLDGAVIVNAGVSGQQTSQMATEAGTVVDNQWISDKKNLLIVWEVGNDLYFNSNISGAQSRISQYCIDRKNAAITNGIDLKIICLTCPPRANVSDSLLVPANEWMIANANTFCDLLVDLRSDPRLETYNTTYFNSDEIHLVTAGNAVVAELIVNNLYKIKG